MNRAEFFALVSDRPTAELARIQLAYWLAKSVHWPFRRDSGESYFEHPRAVAVSLVEHGFKDTEVVVLGLLHDVVEDTNTPAIAIVDLFGAKTWKSVETLSKRIPLFDPVTGRVIGKHKKENERYYREIAEAPEIVRIVKCADRFHNLQNCGVVWDGARQKRYVEETGKYILPLASELRISYEREMEEVILKLRQKGSL